MATLKKVPHVLTYFGNEGPEAARKVAILISNTGSVSTSTNDLARLFSKEGGQLTLELTTVDAKMLREHIDGTGFGGMLERSMDGPGFDSDSAAFTNYRMDSKRAFQEMAYVGLFAFGGLWLVQLVLSFFSMPEVGIAFQPDGDVIPLPVLSIALGGGLAIVEGYYLGLLMGAGGFGWMMGILLGAAMAGLRAISLQQPVHSAAVLCVIGAIIIGADVSLKKHQSDHVESAGISQLKGRLPEIITPILGAHVVAYIINWVWQKLMAV